ncbi:O-succinylhomoserine sulfhydrylase [Frankliniella fusca]|uniref:O-succinylhomoserine sulfhydrylase n=1 Tax=Frankliniella fusca TaxID=407009 RepID=A0AAE1LW74_9NEOP|nr:O-succinylhomoserine sulfhydrylase [Frankliniella fusca]
MSSPKRQCLQTDEDGEENLDVRSPSPELCEAMEHRPRSPSPSTSHPTERDVMRCDSPPLCEPSSSGSRPSSPQITFSEMSRQSSPSPLLEEYEQYARDEDSLSFTSDSPNTIDIDDDFEDAFTYDHNLPDFECYEKHKPVYKNAPITLHQSLVSILTFALTYALSGQCIQSLLRLIDIHCATEDNVFKSSLYLFKKYFAHLNSKVDYQYFCSECYDEVPNKKCLKCKGSPPLCYLVSLPMLDQLEKMFKREGFYSQLRFSCGESERSSGISDVWDGKLFEDLSKLGSLGKPDMLSLSWYTDGALIFESSKLSVWLLQLSINNLPYSERFKKENMLVPAIWLGPVKPLGKHLLEGVYPDLIKLKNGVKMEVQGLGTKKIEGEISNGTGDTPARALMLNMTAHNGEKACQKCYQPGEPREGCAGVRVFPYCPDEMQERTEECFESEGEIASRAKSINSYNGLKGSSYLTKLTQFTVRGTSIDEMHLVFGGINKTLTKLLVDDELSTLPFNVHNKCFHLIDERLLSIKVPIYLTRVPQSLKNFATWKTSLLKSWFLYFALAVLRGAIPDLNYRHFASLVAAIQLLNGDTVSEEALAQAEKLLDIFVAFFEDMYGRANMTLTVHLLLHLKKVVEEQGPLWTTSCFPQERINGEMIKLIHGTRYVDMQMAAAINMYMGLEDILSELEESPAKDFWNAMMQRTSTCKSTRVGDITIFGDIKKIKDVSLHDVNEEFLKEKNLTQTFNSIKKEKCIYIAESHRKTKRDASCASYWDQEMIEVGIIRTFVKSEDDSNVYAVLNKLKIIDSIPTLIPNICVPNIHVYKRCEEIDVIPVNLLHDVCVKMDIDNKLYVAKRCNKQEVE